MLPRVPSARAANDNWYRASGAASFGIGPVQANAWIEQVEERHLPARSSAAERRRFRTRLHLSDLMLARACALGQEAAWEQLWSHSRSRLQAAARALTHNTERAEELADNLLADLYAPPDGEGQRRCKLLAYSGLGSLNSWLCTLLAQAHVNAWRRERREVALKDCPGLQALVVAPSGDWPGASPGVRQAVDVALARVLAAAAAPVRLLLCLYFLDGRTLADIAVLLRVHESTVSRRLDRTLRQLRRQTRRELAAQGLRPAAAEAALHIDPHWLRIDVNRVLRAQPQEGPHGL